MSLQRQAPSGILLRRRRLHEPSGRTPGRPSPGALEAGGHGCGRLKRRGPFYVDKKCLEAQRAFGILPHPAVTQADKYRTYFCSTTRWWASTPVAMEKVRLCSCNFLVEVNGIHAETSKQARVRKSKYSRKMGKLARYRYTWYGLANSISYSKHDTAML